MHLMTNFNKKINDTYTEWETAVGIVRRSESTPLMNGERDEQLQHFEGYL